MGCRIALAGSVDDWEMRFGPRVRLLSVPTGRNDWRFATDLGLEVDAVGIVP